MTNTPERIAAAEARARRVAEIRREEADRRARAEAYLRDGWSVKDVAAKLGMAKSTIGCWWADMRNR